MGKKSTNTYKYNIRENQQYMGLVDAMKNKVRNDFANDFDCHPDTFNRHLKSKKSEAPDSFKNWFWAWLGQHKLLNHQNPILSAIESYPEEERR